ncbi:MAG: gliding motility-associated C-terminal domain-containing protein [Bacteroidetes bacterium]|nr:gliding motility-associated C-terminal domain-containing protein [Bacteroidota bacterium]
MRKYLFLIATLFLLFCAQNILKAQSTLNLKNVSVINEQGHVRISWEYPGTDTLKISRDNLVTGTATSLAIIPDPTITSSYIDLTADAHLQPRSYRIQSIKTSEDFSKDVSTFYLTQEYDSCLRQIKLSWEDLETSQYNASDWTPTQFLINIEEDGNLRTETVNADNQEILITDLQENTNYKFTVETSWQETSETSLSNPINLFTEMPQSPEYIRAISASANGDHTDLKFLVASDSELDTYKLLTSTARDGTYDTLQTISSATSYINAMHENSNPDAEVRFYKMVSINQCGYETTNSDIINNIVLQAENNDYDNSLTWNTFLEGSLESVNYEIYRIVQDQQPELIRSFANHNDFTDNIESLQSYSQFCYFIRATAEGSSEYSQSNTACAYLNPTVYIPEAFTPNGDGTNDLFQPVFTFIPTDYEMRIYNRWGNVVFETSNYTEPWDGKEPNGNSARTGSYIYIIKIETPNNQIIEKRGNITVVYP